MKHCSLCNTAKTEEEFYIQKRSGGKPPRLSGYCKPCTREKYLNPRNKQKKQEESEKNRKNKQLKYSLSNFKDIEGEEWRPILGYEGLYEVSNKARVRSIKDNIYKLRSFPENARLGYCQASLSNNGTSKHHFLHRLVAQAFIPNPDNKPCINHIDGIRNNNDLSNLEWVTHQENTIHAIEILGKHGSLKKVHQNLNI